ncbi:MAG: alkane 1-monooxygenase [Aquabacterium sp.]|uniref:alkane 1-monooxygenase n=1 Tax=Aquabacterium sp. TaxID=1872578 RepID=UPI002A360339|nr:alkane 1-monooxygenase [Aquabacterium sp.]MDX9842599.1 alkane 1-monooxygenase [Aquabacterium sp.]
MSHVQSAPTPTPAPSAAWSDPKRYLWLLGPAVPLIGLAMLAIYAQTRSVWALWFVVILVHAIIPALDWLFGEDAANPPEAALAGLVQDRYYSWVLYAFVPLQLAATVGGAWLAATGDLPWHHLLGLAISVGMVNGVAINTAHELGHKKGKLDRWLARISLAPTFYGHFYVEHNRGHHKNVSTPADPASSRMGETFWAFWPRTVVGSLRSAWHLEAERLARSGKGVWSLSNENLQSWAMSVVLWGSVLTVFGWVALPFLLIQAVYGFSLLEVVNYLEHYGLLRRRLPDGRVERCLPEHSWNSNHMVTNLFLYHLQRHSDHHANPTRHYQALRHFEESPQLPAGYAAMILLAYFPPLWFAVMDKRVIRHYQGDLSRINWYGPRREALMARYADEAAAQARRSASPAA